jgi:hypothetical protein
MTMNSFVTLVAHATEAAGRAAAERGAAADLLAALPTVEVLRMQAGMMQASAAVANDRSVTELRADLARVAGDLALVCENLKTTMKTLAERRNMVAELVESNAVLNSALTFTAMVGTTMTSAVALSAQGGPVGRA